MTDIVSGLSKMSHGYYYNPSASAVKAGVVSRVSFKDLDEAIAHAKEKNALIAAWHKEKRYTKYLTKHSKVGELVVSYFNSLDYINLAESTKAKYKFEIESWLKLKVNSVPLEKTKLCNLSTPHMQRLYESRALFSIWSANETLRCYSLLFNYAMRMGFTEFNPFSLVRKKKVAKRKLMWDKGYVLAFLNTCFSRWEWRNAGIVFYCLYEWGQRPSDILNLKWTSLDLDKGQATITQSKRGATVKLPISGGLLNLLKQQHRDFAHSSEYVAPRMVRWKGKWVPYSINTINNIAKRVMEMAKIPDELQLRDLRRTAITETMEGGADAIILMQMSGHTNINSLQPYLVHTLTGATKAQSLRQFPQQLLAEETSLKPRSSVRSALLSA